MDRHSINDAYSDDDIMINALANKSKMRISRENSISGDAPRPSYNNPVPQYPLPSNQAPPPMNIGMDLPVPPQVNVNKMGNMDMNAAPSRDFSIRSDHSGVSGGSFRDDETASNMSATGMTYEDEMKEKRTLLFKLKRYEKKGFPSSRTYTLNSDLSDLRAEYESLRREANLEQGLKVSKNLLISTCSVLEYLNNKFDPMDIVLDGWTEEVNEDVEEQVYDEVLEELYYKYYDKVSVGPEITLLTMLGGSAVKFHMTQTLLKTMVPDAETLLKQNPNLKNEISDLINKNVPGVQNLNHQINNMMMNDKVGGLGRQKQEMAGPSDVEQIIRDIEKDADVASNASSERRRRRKANVLEMSL